MAMVSKSRKVETDKAFNIDSQGYGFENAPCIKPSVSPIRQDPGEKASNSQTRASWSSSVPKGSGKGNADT
jgi:hypothetical protein